jgi:hypothetical protein
MREGLKRSVRICEEPLFIPLIYPLHEGKQPHSFNRASLLWLSSSPPLRHLYPADHHLVAEEMYLERAQAREERKAATMADEETGTGKRDVAMASAGGKVEEKKKVFFVFDKPTKVGEYGAGGLSESPLPAKSVVWRAPDPS